MQTKVKSHSRSVKGKGNTSVKTHIRVGAKVHFTMPKNSRNLHTTGGKVFNGIYKGMDKNLTARHVIHVPEMSNGRGRKKGREILGIHKNGIKKGHV